MSNRLTSELCQRLLVQLMLQTLFDFVTSFVLSILIFTDSFIPLLFSCVDFPFQINAQCWRIKVCLCSSVQITRSAINVQGEGHFNNIQKLFIKNTSES